MTSSTSSDQASSASTPTAMARAPHAKKDCTWYPIAQDEDGKDQLWACATSWRCIYTATRKRTGRKPKYKYNPPEPVVAEPTGGMWDEQIRGFVIAVEQRRGERRIHDDVDPGHPG